MISTVVSNVLDQPSSRTTRPRGRGRSAEFNRPRWASQALVPERLVPACSRRVPASPHPPAPDALGRAHHARRPRRARGKGGDRQPPPLRRSPASGRRAALARPRHWDPLTFDGARHRLGLPRARPVRGRAAALAKAGSSSRRPSPSAPEYAVAVFEQGLFRYLLGETTPAPSSCCARPPARLRPNQAAMTSPTASCATWPPRTPRPCSSWTWKRSSAPARRTASGYELIMDGCHLHPGAAPS